MFICNCFLHSYNSASQISHNLQITNVTSHNCNTFETLSSFYSEKAMISCRCDINCVTIMTLQWMILLLLNCLYWQHTITEMFLIIPYFPVFDGYGECNLYVLQVNVFYPFFFLHSVHCSANMLEKGIYVSRL